MATRSFRLHLINVQQLVQVCCNQELMKRGKDQSDVSIIENASVVVDHEGKICQIGPMAQIDLWLTQFPSVSFDTTIDCSNFCVLPGLVDAHTHPVWSGNRVDEFAMKLAGATYMEVHAKGGGIHNTVRSTRSSSEEELAILLHGRLDRMLKSGTTLVEAKSGYGLTLDSELKQLRVLHQSNHSIEIVATYLGAHATPEGSTTSEATRDIIENQIPALIQAKEANEISVKCIDVFCEKGVFEYQDTQSILQAGKDAGLLINFHGDEIHSMNSGQLGAQLGATAISHVEMVQPKDISAMAQATPPVIAVLLPTTKYILNLPSPPARDMIQAGVPIALGSDFNPNAHCLSMPTAMNMACVLLKMNMNEVLVASTINAAASIGKSDQYGSLEVGKYADMILLKAPQWEHLIYELSDPPIQHVIKKGKIVV